MKHEKTIANDLIAKGLEPSIHSGAHIAQLMEVEWSKLHNEKSRNIRQQIDKRYDLPKLILGILLNGLQVPPTGAYLADGTVECLKGYRRTSALQQIRTMGLDHPAIKKALEETGENTRYSDSEKAVIRENVAKWQKSETICCYVYPVEKRAVERLKQMADQGQVLTYNRYEQYIAVKRASLLNMGRGSIADLTGLVPGTVQLFTNTSVMPVEVEQAYFAREIAEENPDKDGKITKPSFVLTNENIRDLHTAWLKSEKPRTLKAAEEYANRKDNPKPEFWLKWSEIKAGASVAKPKPIEGKAVASALEHLHTNPLAQAVSDMISGKEVDLSSLDKPLLDDKAKEQLSTIPVLQARIVELEKEVETLRKENAKLSRKVA